MPMSAALFPWLLYATPSDGGMYHIASQRKMACFNPEATFEGEGVLIQVAA